MNLLSALKNTEPINDLEMHGMKLQVDRTYCKEAKWLLIKLKILALKLAALIKIRPKKTILNPIPLTSEDVSVKNWS